MRLRPGILKGGVLAGASALLLASSAPPATVPPAVPLVLGHRGAAAYAPENTLASIDKARQLGVEWVENDVQRTGDGALVVIHDATLARTTNVKKLFPGRSPWKVSDFTLAETERLDAGGWFAPRYAGERIPTLGRYLRRLDHNRQSLLLEIKNPQAYPGIERQICEELRRDGWLDGDHVRRRLIVHSFSAASLGTFHRRCPQVRTALLGNPPVGRLPREAAFADQIDASRVGLTAGYVRAVHAVRGAHGRPMRIFAWTVDDTGTAVRLARLGVDGVITDRPDAVREALAQQAAGPAPAS